MTELPHQQSPRLPELSDAHCAQKVAHAFAASPVMGPYSRGQESFIELASAFVRATKTVLEHGITHARVSFCVDKLRWDIDTELFSLVYWVQERLGHSTSFP